MAWYDTFAQFYDASLEKTYAQARSAATAALDVHAGQYVLDVPCGTGQSFPSIVAQIGQGALVGVDASTGMLRRARLRCEAAQWRNVKLIEHDASTLTPEHLAADADVSEIDRLHIFLGMTTFSNMEQTFAQLWSLLRVGGRCVIVDVHAERLGLQGFLVNQIARAEIRRRFWEPLEAVAGDFERRDLPFRREHGGQIMLATGIKRA